MEIETISRPTPTDYFGNLPDEILIEIFTYLPFNDLKMVTMTSQAFNQVVGQSTKLMKKFRLKISPKRKWDFNSIQSFKRKHRNVKVSEFKDELSEIGKVIGGLSVIGWHVKSLQLIDCMLSKTTLVNILNSMGNLNHVVLSKVKLSELSEETSELINCLSLSSLKVQKCGQLLEVFQSARNIKEIVFEAVDENRDLKAFENILLNQKSLKTLDLSNIQFSNFLESTVNFPFQLTSLTIHQSHFNVKENLEKFLKSQDQLIKFDITVSGMKLKLDGLRYFEDSLSIVLNFKNLREVALDFENYNFNNLNFLNRSVITSVLRLKLSLSETSCSVNSILKVFPEIQSLELSVKIVDDEQIEYINEKLHKLVELKISKFPSEAFGKLKIRTLKSLNANEVNIELLDWTSFLNNNPGIVKLIITFTFFMDLSESFVEMFATKLNLEHLELIDKWIGMRNEVYETIVEHSKNLKYLKLWNINIEQNFNEHDKAYLRSRNIRFHLFNDESLNTPMIPF